MYILGPHFVAVTQVQMVRPCIRNKTKNSVGMPKCMRSDSLVHNITQTFSDATNLYVL